MLHYFSGIIYLIVFALHPITCNLDKTSTLIYSTKPFLLIDCLPYQKTSLTLTALYTLVILIGQVDFERQFTGGVSNF